MELISDIKDENRKLWARIGDLQKTAEDEAEIMEAQRRALHGQTNLI